MLVDSNVPLKNLISAHNGVLVFFEHLTLHYVHKYPFFYEFKQIK